MGRPRQGVDGAEINLAVTPLQAHATKSGPAQGMTCLEGHDLRPHAAKAT